MNDKKSNAPAIVIVVLAVLALPCLAGVGVVVAGRLLWTVGIEMPDAPLPTVPMVAPLVIDDPESQPRAEEAKAETSEPAMP